MRAHVKVGVAVVALLALSACGKKAQTPATGTGAPSAITAEVAKPAVPLREPERKPGLWEQTVSSDKMRQVSKICFDEALARKLTWWGGQTSKDRCATHAVTAHAGGGWAFNAVCDLGASGKVASSGVATGDFGSHYRVEVTSTTTGSSMPEANGEHKIAIEATWKGPCPADMKPGDMTLPGGLKLNMAQMMDKAGK